MEYSTKSDLLDSLLSRQDYLVVQANDLAKSFGNLKAFEHKILDYCFSYVQKDSHPSDIFIARSQEILKYFGLNSSGKNYIRVAKAFKILNENTALYFSKTREDGKKSILMTQLFEQIEFIEDGTIEFKFSKQAMPYIFNLKSNFYSFKLLELSQVKSKYTIILMKLWESERYRDNFVTVIQGSLDEYKQWFLGASVSKDRIKKWTPARFKQQVLDVACKELENKLGIEIELKGVKQGRNIVGYQMFITDTRVRR